MLVSARRLALLIFVGLGLLVFVVAGCGGGDDDTEAATETDIFEPVEEPTTEEEEAAPAEEPAADPPAPADPPAAAEPVVVVKVNKNKPVAPGSQGAAVESVQQGLKELGYNPGKIDGVYGTKTRKAIIAFQRDAKLTADGIVGQKTANAMNAALEEQAASG